MAGERRFEGVGGGAKRGAEGVANGLEDVSIVRFDGLPEDLIVAAQSGLHGGWVAFPHPGRAFYVRKQKGDGAGGRDGHLVRLLLLLAAL